MVTPEPTALCPRERQPAATPRGSSGSALGSRPDRPLTPLGVRALGAALPAPSARRSPRTDPAKFLEDVADAIEPNRGEFLAILTRVDNRYGAEYELRQVLKTLRGARDHELTYLERAEGVHSVAVFGSRNIPLYTTVMHGLIPASVAEHVHFRTPQLTGAIYVELLSKLKRHLPEYDLSGLEIHTKVAYDVFRKQKILGLNKQGRPVDHPAEVVIFVGSPETAEDILSKNCAKIEALGDRFPSFKQIFLKFGTGLNPVIVTQHAEKVLPQAVEAAVESIKINNGQDCIAPKLYAVHTSLLEPYAGALLEAVRKLRVGALDDPEADYNPLSFTERVDALEAFRARHAAHLLNPEAVLDRETRLVGPHVFLFPFEKLKNGEVELKDHYAPYLILFSYQSDEELRELANDPRVRERAMFASLFGDASSPAMWPLRKMFEDNFHTTTLNLNVFDEESGNFPFGGYGGMASSVTILRKDAGGPLELTSIARPLLFSKEAATFFESEERRTPPATIMESRPNPVAREELAGILRDATDPEYQAQTKLHDYDQLREPQRNPRPHGLAALRKKIREGGLRTIVNTSPQLPRDELDRRLATPEGRRALAKFYGAPVVDWERMPEGSVHQLPGVLLHSTCVGRVVRPLNTVRGELNPHLGWGVLSAILTDRAKEYLLLEAIHPGCVPKSETFEQIASSGTFSSDLLALRSATRARLDAMIRRGRHPSPAELASLEGALRELVDGILSSVQARFSKGAFVKNYGESTTGDLGNQITSFHFNTKNIVRQYLGQLENVSSIFATSSGQADKAGVFPSQAPIFQQWITSDCYATGTRFVNKLLTDPDTLLFQERVKIARTDLGFNKEIRVDFVDGEPVTARGRFTHEYMREEEEEAMSIFRKVFARAPEALKHLPGGADLAKLEDGTWKIIELNAGPYSGSIAAQTFPIDTNRFISALQGKSSELIEELELIFAAPLEQQRRHLAGLRVLEEKWNKGSLDDLSLAEVAKYLRDRYLDAWREEPSSKRAEETLTRLRALFEGLGGPHQRDLPLLIRGAENYLRGKLARAA